MELTLQIERLCSKPDERPWLSKWHDDLEKVVKQMKEHTSLIQDRENEGKSIAKKESKAIVTLEKAHSLFDKASMVHKAAVA